MIEKVAALIAETVRNKGKVLICGNGGLAAESEHFAAELMGQYAQDVYIPCIALTTNSSLITAVSNDKGFDNVFAHQVRTLGQEQDMLIAMTTSQSLNIVKAVNAARDAVITTVFVCSNQTPQDLIEYLYGHQVAIVQAPGNDTAEVQNEIIKFLHQVAREAKRMVYDGRSSGKP